MRIGITTLATVSLAASGAVAQFPAGLTQLFGQLSTSCQTTLLGLLTSSETECLHIPEVAGILGGVLSSNSSSNDSLVLPIDQMLAVECSSAGCSNATITSLAANLTSGCSEDLAKYNISNATVSLIAQHYPLAREVVCLGTSSPYNASVSTGENSTESANSTGSTNSTESTNSTSVALPLTAPPFNITNGTAFCATSLLSLATDRLGQNITTGTIVDVYNSYMNGTINSTLAELVSHFEVSDICDECIFAAADVVGVVYPVIGNLTLADVGITPPAAYANVTLSSALDLTCATADLTWTSNGTLPANITLGAVNSTFGYNLTAGNDSYTPEASSTPITRRRRANVVDVKARWFRM